MSHTPPAAVVELLASDLNRQGGVFCPSTVAHTGAAKCPYCGTVYRLKAGETVAHGH